MINSVFCSQNIVFLCLLCFSYYIIVTYFLCIYPLLGVFIPYRKDFNLLSLTGNSPDLLTLNNQYMFIKLSKQVTELRDKFKKTSSVIHLNSYLSRSGAAG